MYTVTQQTSHHRSGMRIQQRQTILDLHAFLLHSIARYDT